MVPLILKCELVARFAEDSSIFFFRRRRFHHRERWTDNTPYQARGQCSNILRKKNSFRFNMTSLTLIYISEKAIELDRSSSIWRHSEQVASTERSNIMKKTGTIWFVSSSKIVYDVWLDNCSMPLIKRYGAIIFQCFHGSHVRYFNILTWLRGFRDKGLYLVLFSLYPKVFWELRDKRTLKFAILTWKPPSHVRILIYRTWLIHHKLAIKLGFLCWQTEQSC